jgi:putative tricarboxylic transport membrane protein
MASDRVFGVVVILGALAYIASALQIQTSFLSDPVGSKTFPIIVASVALLCGLIMVLRPDPEPAWPARSTLGALAVTVAVLVAYSYALKPLGFIIPSAFAATIISYQIDPRPRRALIFGVGLSLGLFVLFKFILGLGLVAFPKALIG